MEVLSARNLHMFHRSSEVSTSRFEGFSHVWPPCQKSYAYLRTHGLLILYKPDIKLNRI